MFNISKLSKWPPFWARDKLFFTGSWIYQKDSHEHFRHFERLIDAVAQILTEIYQFQILTYFVILWRHQWRHECAKQNIITSLTRVIETWKHRVSGPGGGGGGGGGVHRCSVDFPHKGPVTRKMFPFNDVIMDNCTACCDGQRLNVQIVKQGPVPFANVSSNLLYKAYEIPKYKCFSSRPAVVFAQSIVARCSEENLNVVTAAPTGDAPATSKWSQFECL